MRFEISSKDVMVGRKTAKSHAAHEVDEHAQRYARALEGGWAAVPKRTGRALASTRFTLVGMLLLAIGAAFSYGNPDSTPVWVLVVPMAVLAMNLLAAIATNPRINRRGGLLTFHLGLLAVIVLAGIGRLTHMDAHLEIVEGDVFAPAELYDIRQGPLHGGALKAVSFRQGAYEVDYTAGMARGKTRSHVEVADGRGGWDARVIGDDIPLVIEGYRFYTTYNKGLAPVLTWTPHGGAPTTGTVHMPSYPLFENKQTVNWAPPGGRELKLWLRVNSGLKYDAAWTLASRAVNGLLVVMDGSRRWELAPGDEIQLQDGRLRYERMVGWVGYKLFYDPTLRWLFIASVVGVLGLSLHFWQRYGVIRYASIPAPAGAEARVGVPSVATADLQKGVV